jgi:hypothetical protein
MKDEDLRLVNAHVAQLSEFFDTVQIFCTRHQNTGTINVNCGSGNWYTRYGHIKCWIRNEENRNDDNFCIESESESENDLED